MKLILHLLMSYLLLSSCSKSSSNSSPEDTWGTQPDLPVVSGTATLTIPANGYYVNAMGNTIPRMPNFPALSVKANIARGYVADLKGNPVKNAHIGVSRGIIFTYRRLLFQRQRSY